jgi:hypothetical protein
VGERSSSLSMESLSLVRCCPVATAVVIVVIVLVPWPPEALSPPHGILPAVRSSRQICRRWWDLTTGDGGEDSSYQAWPGSSLPICPSSEDDKMYLLSIYLFGKKRTVSS